eukprot:TRINITY_DN10387_c0_g1_i1.p1 TRINITY_DN10387_c0_g1~~TRINITY_DN10387_c0_g1_i1.p1  ORF type:complete len:634 (+),score=184.48 TRINITY_DN10387_c0_g1_i1:702-2603(+)
MATNSTVCIDVDRTMDAVSMELTTTKSYPGEVEDLGNAFTTWKENQYCLEFKNLNVIVATKHAYAGLGRVLETKQILTNVSGTVTSGQLLAIIGPSGSGKSTTLDALAGRRDIEEGSSVTLNGRPLDFKLFSTACSYMPQDDRLISSLTVYENLMYALRLATGSTLTAAEREERVEQTMQSLGLMSVAHSRVGDVFIKGISGGQKRRVSIGLELITNPAVLFLDEPTSGLDAASAASIMGLLNTLAKRHNMLIVASVHQPASHVFLKFDQLLLLSKGRTAYMGSATDSLEYFKNLGHPVPQHLNPADHLLQLVNSDFGDTGEHVDEILDAWATRAPNTALAVQYSSTAKPAKTQSGSWLSRLWVLTERTLIAEVKNPVAFGGRFANYLFLAIMLGTMYVHLDRDQEGILQRGFIVQLMLAFNGFLVVASVALFAQARDVVAKEVVNGLYSCSQYVVATSIVQAFTICIYSFAALIPVFWIAGPLRNEASVYWTVQLTLFLVLYTFEGLAVLIGTNIRDWMTAFSTCDTFMGMFFVFNGYFIAARDVPWVWRWIIYISPLRYGSEVMVHTIIDGATFKPCQPNELCYGTDGSVVVNELIEDGSSVNVPAWLMVIVAEALVFRLLVWYSLRQISK